MANKKVCKRCKHCGKQYELGRNGIVGSCDTCAQISRDKDGFIWFPTEETQLRQNVGNSRQFTVTRSEAFGE